VTPDARGVLLGDRGLLLFPSLDRLVAFLRAYAEQDSLDELLVSLKIRQLVTPLKTREAMLSCTAESSYRMDKLASVARLSGGLCFTGTSRHFVRYRDAASPLGYDVAELAQEAADLIVYDQAYQQSYSFERDLDLRALLLRLDPVPTAANRREAPPRLFVTAETGVGGAITGYLFRWGVDAKVALAEWPPESAFDDRGTRLYVFDITSPPARITTLLASLPGVKVYAPDGPNVAVELGFHHPVSLTSCQSLFSTNSLTLLPSRGDARQIAPLPAFAPVESLVRADISQDGKPRARMGKPSKRVLEAALPLRLAPSSDAWRNVVATIVPSSQIDWLARMVYALPSDALRSLRIAFGEGGEVYLHDPNGIEGVPLGEFASEVAPRIYVPAGFSLVPAVSSDVLLGLLKDRGDAHIFFTHGAAEPSRVPDQAFREATRALLHEISTRVVSAAAPQEEPPLGLFDYAEARRLPLFALPGVKESASESAEGDEAEK